MAAFLAGCASSPPSGSRAARVPHPVYKIGAPYEIKGVTYYPRVDYSYDATGMASWYGEQFQGRYTANGEVFDLHELTAAHTTLPLPSIVEVTNLRNGRTLRLRVNDRGPFAHGRILDVSRHAARELGFENAGTAPVRVRILPRASMLAAAELMRGTPEGQVMLAQATAAPDAPYPSAARTAPRAYAAAAPSRRYSAAPPVYAAAAPSAGYQSPSPVYAAAATSTRYPASPAVYPAVAAAGTRYQGGVQPVAQAPQGYALPKRYFVQTAPFARPESARRAEYAVAGLGRVAIITHIEGGYPVYRVLVGPIASGAEAEQVLARVVGTGYAGSRIIED